MSHPDLKLSLFLFNYFFFPQPRPQLKENIEHRTPNVEVASPWLLLLRHSISDILRFALLPTAHSLLPTLLPEDRWVHQSTPLKPLESPTIQKSPGRFRYHHFHYLDRPPELVGRNRPQNNFWLFPGSPRDRRPPGIYRFPRSHHHHNHRKISGFTIRKAVIGNQ